MSELVGLPAWNHKQGICWRCNITLDELTEVDEGAAWRQPQSRLSHGDLLKLLSRHGRLCRLFDFPGFTSKLFRVDWLHAADLGITAKWFGAILHLCMTLKCYGTSQESRLALLWKDTLAWYAAEGAKNPSATANRLRRLPLKSFKHINKRPCLKASGGQIRTLMLWFLKTVRSWDLENLPPQIHDEVGMVQLATEHLAICYDALSSSAGPTALSDLKCHSVRYAELLVGLAAINDGRYSIPPKLHLWLELCSESCTPSKSWNCRDEDFGGSLATMARRRGGRESGLATSRNTLQAYMVKQPLPTLGKADVQGASSS